MIKTIKALIKWCHVIDRDISRDKSGYIGKLVMIDHFTKFVEAAPCREFTAEENFWNQLKQFKYSPIHISRDVMD